MRDTTSIEAGARSRSTKRAVSVALGLLMAFSVILAGLAAFRVWNAVPDSYPNQQLKLLSIGITQVFLVGVLLAQHHGRKPLGWALVVPTAVALSWTIALM